MAIPAAFRTLYRVFTWSSLAVLVLALVLVLRSPAAPSTPPDPDAAARVEQKFAQADQAKAAGQAVDVDLARASAGAVWRCRHPRPGANRNKPAHPRESPATRLRSNKFGRP